MLLEFSIYSSYFILIVDIKPDLTCNSLNKLFNNEEIVVFPFVPVTPIKSIFEDGLSKKFEAIIESAVLEHLTHINTILLSLKLEGNFSHITTEAPLLID